MAQTSVDEVVQERLAMLIRARWRLARRARTSPIARATPRSI
jgi:hypothetical protein